MYNAHGTLLQSQDDIKWEFLNYFQGMIGTNVSTSSSVVSLQNILGKSISAEESELLVAPITDAEIHAAMKSINPNKSPGPDGFTSHFYIATWDIVGDDVLKAVHSFFSSAKLLREINATYIALVLKISNPTLVKDYRPISCCNTI